MSAPVLEFLYRGDQYLRSMVRPRVVRNLAEANSWAKHAVADCQSLTECWRALGWSPIEELQGGKLDLSTTCTGIDTPVYASLLFSNAIETTVGRGIALRNVHACERDLQCIEELLHGPLPPECVFDNMLNWLSAAQNRELKGVKSGDTDKVRAAILGGTLKTKAWCVAHGKLCFLRHSHMNISGTPCIHHSTFGKREGMGGGSNRVYYVWAKQRMDSQERMWILENVSEFGLQETLRCLGHLYDITRIVANSNDEGWRSSRFRQFLVGRHKALKSVIPPAISERFSVLADVRSVFEALFTRTCVFNQNEYKIATEEELRAELEWMQNRPHVLLRYDPERLAVAFPHHVPFQLRCEFCKSS